jgi:hypothetical protein
MWAAPSADTVVFETRVKGRPNWVAISNAAVVFRPGRMAPMMAGGGDGGGGLERPVAFAKL